MESSLKEEKAAGESGDDEKAERSSPINLNSLPATAAAAAAAPDEDGLHSAVESGAKDSNTTKGVESLGTGHKKIPKREVVDEVDVQTCAEGKNDSVVPSSSKNPINDKNAKANVAENGQSADGIPEDQRVTILSVVKKDEPADDVRDSVNPVTVVGYRDEKGGTSGTAGTTAVRPAGTRSSSFHGIDGVENMKLICGTVRAEWKGGEEKESKLWAAHLSYSTIIAYCWGSGFDLAQRGMKGPLLLPLILPSMGSEAEAALPGLRMLRQAPENVTRRGTPEPCVYPRGNGRDRITKSLNGALKAANYL
uniref:Uncharacterized protein n=1 Tax=Oryza meridionalis TaxID=40149 RepID=A0A0E0CRH6_9ORYZ